MFWAKLVVPLALAALSFAAVRRLASPGQHPGPAAGLGPALLALLWTLAALDIGSQPAAARCRASP